MPPRVTHQHTLRTHAPVLLHSPDTCSSFSSYSDTMQMRVLAACAVPRRLPDVVLNKTLLSLFSFILPLPVISRVSALAACHRATPWTSVASVMREPPLSLPLRPWGIIACILSLQKHHQVRSARVSPPASAGELPWPLPPPRAFPIPCNMALRNAPQLSSSAQRRPPLKLTEQ